MLMSKQYSSYFGEGAGISRNWATTTHFLAFYGQPWNCHGACGCVISHMLMYYNEHIIRLKVCCCGGGCLVIQLVQLLQSHGWDCQAPLSMGFPRQEYWSWLPFPSAGDLPHPEIELSSLHHLLYDFSKSAASLPVLFLILLGNH